MTGLSDHAAERSVTNGCGKDTGNANITNADFCVMKYEAKKDGTTGQAVSTAAGTPWVDVSWYEANSACKRVGAHLVNEGEWLTIARNIEATTSNDIDGAAGIQLATGHSDSSPNSALASDGSDAYYGTTDSSAGAYSSGAAGKAQKRTHTLSNGEVIWDLAGNVWEWTDAQCDSTNWYSSGAWIEWNNANLTDWEKLVAGPSGALTATNGAGRYWPCSASGDASFRGGGWTNGATAGVFAMSLGNTPSSLGNNLGFRCAYSNVH